MTPIEAWRAVREEARQIAARHRAVAEQQRAEFAEVHARIDAALAEMIRLEKDAIRAVYPDAQMYFDEMIGVLKVWLDPKAADWRDFSPRPGGVELGLANEAWTFYRKGHLYPSAIEALQAALKPYTPALKPYVPTPRPADDGRPV